MMAGGRVKVLFFLLGWMQFFALKSEIEKVEIVNLSLEKNEVQKIRLYSLPTSAAETIRIPHFICTHLSLEIVDSVSSNRTIVHPNIRNSHFELSINSSLKNKRFFLNVKQPYIQKIKIEFYKSDQNYLFFYTLFAIYFGIIVIMFIYNFIVYVSTRQSSYLYYVIYMLFFGCAQWVLTGFLPEFFQYSNLYFWKTIFVYTSVLSGMGGMFFFNKILKIKTRLPKLYKVILLIYLLYTVAGILYVFNLHFLVFAILNICVLAIACVAFIGSLILFRRKIIGAKYFLLAFSVFILCLIWVVTTNIVNQVPLPLNPLVLPIGHIAEIALLSFMLSNRINKLLKDNQKLIKDKNKELEQLVAMRTAQLEKANVDLKQAQAQLVNNEKMSGLGQLTAGIAHEINNPLNFISASIYPLRRDLEEYQEIFESYGNLSTEDVEKIEEIKSEIDDLLHGIETGSNRTAEIVKNLKIFSHLDRASFSEYDLNDGVMSTLNLLKYKSGDIQVNLNLPQQSIIDCYPGKINQLFMNLLSNAIDAVENITNPEILVTIEKGEQNTIVCVSDNGIGIDKENQNRIFEPFFTTKETGKGTGLGLSISYTLVQEHKGEIWVESQKGSGSRFYVKLPNKL